MPPKIVSISAQRVLDRITNSEFISKLFPPLKDDELLCWTHFTGSHHNRRGWPDHFVHHPDEILDADKANTFYSPSLYTDASRKIDNFSRYCVLVIDDIDPDELNKRLPPTYVISTSESKYQAGWKLKTPVGYEQAIELLRYVYAGNFKKDAGGQVIPTRYVRLPRGTNHSHDPKPKQRLLVFEPSRVYEHTDIVIAIGGTPQQGPASGSGWQTISIEAAALPRNEEGKINDGRFMLYMRWSMYLANQGKTQDEIEATLYEFALKNFEEGENWWDDRSRNLRQSIRTAVNKVTREFKQDNPLPFVPEPISDDDWPREIARREFCLYPFFPRKVATTIVAGGGAGKSMLVAHIAAHAVSGKPFGPYLFDRPMKVAIYTYEDDKEEYKRRLTPYLDAVDPKWFRENLRIVDNSDDDLGYWVGYDKQDRQLHDTGACEAIIESLRAFEPDFVFFDTLSQLNGAEEDNATFSKIAKLMSYFSKELNCSSTLLHHVSKVAQLNGQATQSAARGGSALVDNTRGGLQIVPLNSRNLKEVFNGKILNEGIDANRFLAVVHTKANYAGMVDPLLFERVYDDKAHTAFLRMIDTSSLMSDAPTKEEKKFGDIEIAVAWLKTRGSLSINSAAKLKENKIEKPAGLIGSLKAALEKAKADGLVEIVEEFNKAARQTIKVYRVVN